jgi:hypothetical protein
MPMTPGCWANVLDDCDGPLSAEHLISVAIFAAADGMPNNRKGRLARQVTVQGGHHLPDGQMPVRDLTADILCRHHNTSTSDLDEVGGRFARAIENWNTTKCERSWLRQITWNRRTYEVDGPLLERLLLKLAVNNAFLNGLPIGGPDAQAGWPTRELVEMVYGRRPIVRPAGLFNLSMVGQQFDFAEKFTPIYFDNGRYLEGCVWMFRTLIFGVQFTMEQLPARVFDRVPTLRGTARLQPFNALNSPLNVELRLRW